MIKEIGLFHGKEKLRTRDPPGSPGNMPTLLYGLRRSSQVVYEFEAGSQVVYEFEAGSCVSAPPRDVAYITPARLSQVHRLAARRRAHRHRC